MRSARVTVLMPVYNGAQYLREAIESILAQTLADFELVIVDDGSTDDSRPIVRAFDDDRIRAYNREHEGLPASLNFGVSVAQTPWIARMDADDAALADRLERQLAAVAGDERLVVLGGQCILMDEAGRALGQTKIALEHDALLDSILYARGHPLHHPSVLLRTEALRKIGGYRCRFQRAQDVDLWLRMAEVGTLRCLAAPVLRLRQHAASASLDAGGRTQALYGLAARICYLRRKAGAADPSELGDAQWREFLIDVERVCERNGVFRARAARQTLRERLQCIDADRPLRSIRRIVRLATALIAQPTLLCGLSRRGWLKTLRSLGNKALS